MSKKNCFAYISGNKCVCLSVMNCYTSDNCCFFKTKTQFLEDQRKSEERLERVTKVHKR